MTNFFLVSETKRVVSNLMQPLENGFPMTSYPEAQANLTIQVNEASNQKARQEFVDLY